jgi:hypothetical protein
MEPDHLMLSREQILAAVDLPRETVEVPEWGGAVIVSTMTGADRDAFEASVLTGGKPDLRNMRAKLVAACVVDEAGNRLFSSSDIEALGRKAASALDRVTKAAQRLNRMGEEQFEELKGN